MAKINLRKFVESHYKGGVSVRDVVREAVTNSIHAGAQSISIKLDFSDYVQTSIAGVDTRPVLNSISITDDGEGFTAENLQFFDEVCTSHKDAIGGKGVGRLSFLKFARKVQIASQIETDFVEFDYGYDFNPEKVKRTPRIQSRETCVLLSELINQVETKVEKLVNSTCDDLRLLLFLRKQQGIKIDLIFQHDSEQSFDARYVYSNDSINALSTKEFDFCDETFTCYLFKDEPPKKGIVTMLCADDLSIEESQISKRFDICRYCIFVTSGYFNSRANMERQKLEMPQSENDTDLASPISREKLIPKIQAECMSMVEEFSPSDLNSFKANNLAKLQQYYPYINTHSLGGNAKLLDAEEVINAYRKVQEKREDQLVEKLEKGTASIDDISHLARDDLAKYIVHRALVIDSLSKMPTASAEAELHRAFLPKNNDGTNLYENNIWLVDDKFLSYSNVYSDETLKAIVVGVNAEAESKQHRKPDIAVFFTKDNEDSPNKLVIVEFKKQESDVFGNAKSLTQCRLYANELVEKIPSVLEVFAFAVVEINDEFYRELKQTNYKDIFSPKERIVYQDFRIGEKETVPMHQYVLPTSALLKDAKARNKVFEDILKLEGLQ